MIIKSFKMSFCLLGYPATLAKYEGRLGVLCMNIGPVIACLFTSALLFLFSYLIWKRQEFTLIAGFNENTFRGDKNKLANSVGFFLMTSGVLILILPLGIGLVGLIAGQVISILIILGIVILIFYINRLSKSVA